MRVSNSATGKFANFDFRKTQEVTVKSFPRAVIDMGKSSNKTHGQGAYRFYDFKLEAICIFVCRFFFGVERFQKALMCHSEAIWQDLTFFSKISRSMSD